VLPIFKKDMAKTKQSPALFFGQSSQRRSSDQNGDDSSICRVYVSTGLALGVVFATVGCIILQEVQEDSLSPAASPWPAMEIKYGQQRSQWLKVHSRRSVVLGCAAYKPAISLGVSGLNLITSLDNAALTVALS